MRSYTWDSRENPSELYIIVGNGFDIECGLPTCYAKFLKEARETIEIYDELCCYSHETLCGTWIEQGAQNIESYLSMKNNFWYRHYLQTNLRNNWVDFEEEMRRLVTKIEESVLDTYHSHSTFLDDYLLLPKGSDLVIELADILNMSQYKPSWFSKLDPFSRKVKYSITYRQLYKTLKEDHDAFIDVLDKYFSYHLGLRHPRVTKSIRDVIEEARKIDNVYVISFNYSKTLEQILKDYGIEVDVCYVHGKLSSDTEEHSIVLGIDDHTNSSTTPQGFRLDWFRKSDQRRRKHTDASFENKTNDFMENPDIQRELIIFGHSLNLNDAHIIMPFLKATNMRTRIYCKDDESWYYIYKNLTNSACLGEELYGFLENAGVISHVLTSSYNV